MLKEYFTGYSRANKSSKYPILIHFSLNDAALVVDELVKQGKWLEFIYSSGRSERDNIQTWEEFTAWLLTMQNGEATNFFRAFARWIEEEGR